MFEDGATTVSENVVHMEKIQQSINESNRVIDDLSNHVGEVDSMYKLLTRFRNKPLNAAVEAGSLRTR